MVLHLSSATLVHTHHASVISLVQALLLGGRVSPDRPDLLCFGFVLSMFESAPAVRVTITCGSESSVG
jgi:hypothetical protein